MMISGEYQRVLRATHTTYPVWGHGHASNHLTQVLASDPSSVLDYGCGKGGLVEALRALNVKADGYDPGITQWELKPRGEYALVTCFDVMEHIEPEYLDAVLADIAHYGETLLATISLVPAKKNLIDGRNAHLIVQPAAWWKAKLHEHYAVIEYETREKFGQEAELVVVCLR